MSSRIRGDRVGGVVRQVTRPVTRPATRRVAAGVALSALLVGCNVTEVMSRGGEQGAPEEGGAPWGAPPQVEVVTVAPRAVTLTTELAGRTEPFRFAEVRPQVGGIIQARAFREGALIEAGQLLYRIDPALHRANVNSAEAALAKARANLTTARLKAERYRDLLGRSAISEQDSDDADALYQQARAAVAVERARLRTAQINLDYTEITSPISGRIGRSSVTQGALVTAGQPTALAIVRQLDPIYVDLTQAGIASERLRGLLARDEGAEVAVTLLLADGAAYEHRGRLAFSESTVDRRTGSVTLRALFPNPERRLLPGMFVRARVESERVEGGLLVPVPALSRDPKGRPTVMVVGEGERVEPRVLGGARLVGDEWLIEEGLAEGERVIVAGLQHIRPGVEVTVVDQGRAPDLTTAALD